VRGDAESITFNTTFRLRMQARFKPRNKASKEEKARDDDEVKRLKKARREGNFHETALDLKVKSSHDKYAS
jgi:protein FRG1